MEKANWGVVIVAYHPDLKMLENTLAQIQTVTTNIVVANNGERFNDFAFAQYVAELNDNRGIAYAQNAGVQRLQQADPAIERVFLLDQDSELPLDFFKAMNAQWDRLQGEYPRLGALSPIIHQRGTATNYSLVTFANQRFATQHVQAKPGLVIADTLPIASGMLISTAAYTAIGGMAEKWFIDWVDFDFDLRMLKAGYAIVTTGDVVIDHKIGTPAKRKLLKKPIIIPNYVMFREYYYFRNGVYMLKRHARFGNGIGKYVWGRFMRRVVAIFYESKRLVRTWTIAKGFFVGLFTPSK